MREVGELIRLLGERAVHAELLLIHSIYPLTLDGNVRAIDIYAR